MAIDLAEKLGTMKRCVSMNTVKTTERLQSVPARQNFDKLLYFFFNPSNINTVQTSVMVYSSNVITLLMLNSYNGLV